MPDGGIRMPRPGYNKELEIYCALSSPPIRLLDIEQAIEVLKAAHLGFQFKNEQSRVHAHARFMTPFFRGIIGYSEPVPCWYFNANRPRCGKDYLAGVTQITYEGFAFEDAALGSNPEETRKRITAGLMGGRRSFHFANCQGHLSDKYYIQAITDTMWRDRLLGSNDSSSDLLVANEAEYSVSANVGLTYREDIEPRMRAIHLVFYEEDANSRIFPVEDLHGWVRTNRTLLLSALYTIFDYWQKKGMPLGHPFASYKRWGKILAGVMALLELGNPTLPHEDQSLLSGDLRTEGMKAVYELIYDLRPELWTPKKDIYQIIAANQDNDDRLSWFGDLCGDTKKSAQTKLGKTISAFEDRVFSGITMRLDTSLTVARLWKVQFSRSP